MKPTWPGLLSGQVKKAPKYFDGGTKFAVASAETNILIKFEYYLNYIQNFKTFPCVIASQFVFPHSSCMKFQPALNRVSSGS